MKHRFEIGTKYLSAGKHPRLCTVTDQITVTNSKGDVIRKYYESEHEFMGQTVRDREVADATVARGIFRLEQEGGMK